MLKVASFAKINWILRILGKRPDGYHEVVTVLQTISLRDELAFSLRHDPEISLTCDDPEIPLDDSNLIVKAARALQSGRRGADIKLVKRIPPRGGLGGGSSNAAVTLIALNRLWQLDHSNDDLVRIAKRLGADVPFFFTGGAAIAKGAGMDVAALPDGPKQYLIVVTPNASISTATAYASLKAPSLTTTDSDSILSSSFGEPASANRAQWALQNDFEGVIFELEPEIRRAKLALLEAGARGALLAGSGSSVFGILDNEAARDKALGKLRREAGWRVFSCHTLARSEYLPAIYPGNVLLNRQSDTGA